MCTQIFYIGSNQKFIHPIVNLSKKGLTQTLKINQTYNQRRKSLIFR